MPRLRVHEIIEWAAQLRAGCTHDVAVATLVDWVAPDYLLLGQAFWQVAHFNPRPELKQLIGDAVIAAA